MAFKGSSVAQKTSDEETIMSAKRSEYTKFPTPELQATYKKLCADFRALNEKCAVIRAELVSRQNVADAQAKLDKAKADHSAASKEG